MTFTIIFLVLLNLMTVVECGPVACGLCYSACNAGVVACYAATGATFGVAGPVGWYAWFVSGPVTCSAAQSACMIGCSAACVAPTP